MKRRDTIQGQNLQVPFAKISVEDRAQDLLERFSVEAAVQDPCVRLSVPGVFMRSPQKIFVRDLCTRSLSLCTNLLQRSLGKISVQAPDKRSLGKISI